MAIKRKGDRYVVQVYDRAAKNNRHVGTCDTKAEAREMEAKAKLASSRPASKVTVAEFAERWLDDYKQDVRESTRVQYRRQLKAVVREFGHRPLVSIDRTEARRFLMDNRSNQVACAMFSDALNEGLIQANPFANHRLPASRGRKDLEVPTVETVAALVAEAELQWGPEIAALIQVAAYTGMRPGELHALRWGQVDFERGEIHVVESLSSHSGEYTLPKNGQKRTVVMLPPVRDALLRMRRGGPGELLWPSQRGGPMTASRMHYYWDPVRRALHMPEMAFYELRHFCASFMLNDLELPAQDVAIQLGHTDGGVLVLQRYGHPNEELARERIARAYGNVTQLREVS